MITINTGRLYKESPIKLPHPSANFPFIRKSHGNDPAQISASGHVTKYAKRMMRTGSGAKSESESNGVVRRSTLNPATIATGKTRMSDTNVAVSKSRSEGRERKKARDEKDISGGYASPGPRSTETEFTETVENSLTEPFSLVRYVSSASVFATEAGFRSLP